MATEDINKELSQLKSDIGDLRHDMASLVNALKKEGIDQGRQAYDKAYQRTRSAGEAVRERADEAYGVIGKELEEHPFTSVLAAFGTGFVVGMILDRRQHHH
jgi:ElaB/YqjD/DUF883 family membrane-anchored ribosome-binding protein